MFTELFMQRAFLAALFLGPLCALIGVFVTARQMAFFSDTIAHGALTGIAIGIWLGLADPTLPMILFSLLVAVTILWLKEKTNLLTDTIMALLLSGSVAVGVIILSMLKGYRGQVYAYLFGDILAIGPKEVWVAAALFLTITIGLFAFLSPLALLTAHEDLAHASGISVRGLNYLFVIVLTITVATSIRLLGIILVTSLLVVPPAAARNISRNLRQQIVLSVIFGIVGGVAGIAGSYILDIPSGPAIVLACIALFGLSLIPLGFSRNEQLLPNEKM